MPLTLRTPRLLLRPLQHSDRAAFIRAYQDSRDHFAPWSPLRKEGQTLDEYFIDELERNQRVECDGSGLRRIAELIECGPALRAGDIAAFVNLNNIVRG